MKKYLLLTRYFLMEYFAYRLNFFLWRLRVVVSLLITFFLWRSIFKSTPSVLDYQESQMLTYIILLNFVGSLVQSTQTFKIAWEINSGKLNNFLLQPLNYFGFNFSRDLADKILNTTFSFFEIGFLVWVFRIPLVFPKSFFTLPLFIFGLFFATILYFEINTLLSFLGFWSKEIWAPRFVFYILVSFLSGFYFPLDVLPQPVFNLLKISPFPYLVFFPLKIYLGMVKGEDLFLGISIALFWIFLLFFLDRFFWRKGLNIYTAETI